MAEETKTYVFGNDGTGMNSPWPWLAYGNNGLGGNGWGGGILGFLLGALFGGAWGGNGLFGGFGGNGSAGAGYIANALNNDTGRDLILQAVNGNHEAITNLSNILHSDVESVQSAINTLGTGLATLAGKTELSSAQIVNAIQSGNASLASQLCQCCCDNRLLTTQQGYEAQIRTLEQTNQLGAQADRNTNAITGAIAAQTVAMNDGFCAIKERELQGKIDSLLADNSVLRSTISENRQTERFLSAFNALDQKITELAAKQPQTVPVQWPQLTAVSTTPYMGGYYGYGYQGNIWG